MLCHAPRSLSREERKVVLVPGSRRRSVSDEAAGRPHFQEMVVAQRLECFDSLFELHALQNVKAPIVGAGNFAFRQKLSSEAGNERHAWQLEFHCCRHCIEFVEPSIQVAVVKSKLQEASAFDDEFECVFAGQ